MKTKWYMYLVALMGVFVMSACDDDDNPVKVSDSVKEAFHAQFPNAQRVEWEMKKGYYVADFWGNVEMEAWYDSNGKWCMTETDLGINMSQLPEAVQNAFQASAYNMWIVDDLDKYERPDMTFYLIEIEFSGKKDRNLYYAVDGTLLKDEEDKGRDEVYPDTTF